MNLLARSLFFALALTPYAPPAAPGILVCDASSVAGTGANVYAVPAGDCFFSVASSGVTWIRPSALPDVTRLIDASTLVPSGCDWKQPRSFICRYLFIAVAQPELWNVALPLFCCA